MKTDEEIYDMVDNQISEYNEWFTTQLIGIGDNGNNAVNTFYNKHKAEKYLNKPITLSCDFEENTIPIQTFEAARMLAVVTELDNKSFYKISILIAEQHQKTSPNNVLRICS